MTQILQTMMLQPVPGARHVAFKYIGGRVCLAAQNR